MMPLLNSIFRKSWVIVLPTILLLLMLGITPAYAQTLTGKYVSGYPEDSLPATTVYLTNFSNYTVTTAGDVSYPITDTNAAGEPSRTGVGIPKGKQSGSFTIVYKNVGYTVDGRTLNMTVTGSASLTEAASRNATIFSPGSMFCSNRISGVGTQMTLTFNLQYADNNAALPSSETFRVYVHDLDVKGRNLSSYTTVTQRWNDIYSEGIEFISNCGSTVWMGDTLPAAQHTTARADTDAGTRVVLGTHSGNSWAHATHGCDAQSDSAIAWIGTSGMKIVWRGFGADMGSTIFIKSTPTVYPDWSAPVKAPNTQNAKAGDTITFTVSQTLPYIAASNQPQSIVFSDTLNNAFTPVSITASNANAWDCSISGQTVNATAKSTAHGGGAEGDVTFTIQATVKKGYDFAANGISVSNGNFQIPNTGKVVVTTASGQTGGGTKNTNTVNVLVPVPELTLTKDVDQSSVNVSNTTKYTVVLTQTKANAIAEKPVIKDSMSAAYAKGATYLESSFVLKKGSTTLTKGTD